MDGRLRKPAPFYPTCSELSNFILGSAGPDNRQRQGDSFGGQLGRRGPRRGCETPRAWRGAGLAPWRVWAMPSGQRRLVRPNATGDSERDTREGDACRRGVLCLRSGLKPIRMTEKEDYRTCIAEFWEQAAVALSITDRLELLQTYAEKVVRIKGQHNPRNIRRGTLTVAKTPTCWACRMRKGEHRHHVIQIQHGGRNRYGNGVLLCRGCHACVHPWMREKQA